jgi:hypothetical protein
LVYLHDKFVILASATAHGPSAARRSAVTGARTVTSTTRERLPELLRLAETWDDEVSWHTNEEPGFASREEFDRQWGGRFDDDQAVVQVWRD